MTLGCSGAATPDAGAVGACQNADGSFKPGGTLCRVAAGACDVEERCTGEEGACPTDLFLPAATVCRPAAGACDTEERCTGASPTCPTDAFLPSSAVCRPAAGACDAEERCTGGAAACPADAFLPSSAVCRPAAGACDAEERCTGDAAACPADALLHSSAVCRPAAGRCDQAETCTGTSTACPADTFLPAGERCRPAVSACDAAEACPGSGAECPADGFLPAGTACAENGGSTCDGRGTCGTCVNLCLKQTQCAGAATTSISGTVYMPNGVDPLPNTLVYVPNAPVQALSSGVQSCQPCSALVSGAPLVRTVTDASGHFTLTNMPVGAHIPLVIQNGKWRRQFDLPSVTACVETAVSQQLRMPASRAEGDLPKIALVAGGFSALECVLLKLGIAPEEFGNGSSGSPLRVQFYLADGNPGAHYDSATPLEAALWGTQASLNQYDLVFLGCQGSLYPRTPEAQQTLITYANLGGEVIVNHYEYVWIYDAPPFAGTAIWHFGQPKPVDPQAGVIDTSFTEGSVLSQWLALTDPTGATAQVPLDLVYTELDGVVPPSRVWLNLNDPLYPHPVPMQYTFETPVGAPPAQQCGRVMFNEYHTMEHFPSETLFPSACDSTPLRTDELLMAFMLFELGTCH